MSQILQLELSDVLFTALTQQAAAEGTKPEIVAVETLQDHFRIVADEEIVPSPADERQAAQRRFEQRFGTWNVTGPVGLDNEQIDADLAAEYGRGLDDT